MAFVGNIVEAMAAYGRGELGEIAIPLSAVDRLIVIGSDGMMKAVQQARHGVLRPYLKPDHHAIGSINSPMQCMMKEICAQCLQMHKDPVTGEEPWCFRALIRISLSITWISAVSGPAFRKTARRRKVTKLWIDHCLRDIGVRQSKFPAVV